MHAEVGVSLIREKYIVAERRRQAFLQIWDNQKQIWKNYSIFNFYLLIFLERKGGRRDKHLFVVPLIYSFIDWFLYVPCLGIKPAILVYQDSTLTNWATPPLPRKINFKREALSLCFDRRWEEMIRWSVYSDAVPAWSWGSCGLAGWKGTVWRSNFRK